jgi:hypothetical protein
MGERNGGAMQVGLFDERKFLEEIFFTESRLL